MTVCFRSDSASNCVDRGFGHYIAPGGPGFRWLDRAYPTLSPPRPPTPSAAYTEVYRIRVGLGAAEARFLEVGATGSEGCPWQIVDTSGLALSGGLPAARVEFTVNTDATEAWLEVARPRGEANCAHEEDYFPPGLFELPESHYSMIEGVRTRGVIDGRGGR